MKIYMYIQKTDREKISSQLIIELKQEIRKAKNLYFEFFELSYYNE